MRQYESARKKFQEFLFFARDVVFQFLHHLFQVQQIARATGNIVVAVLKDPWSAAFGISLEGQDLDLLRQSFFLQWPPRKGHCHSWLLQKVLDFLPSDDFGERAGPYDLLLKVLFLLSLASGLQSLQLHAFTHHEAWTVFSEDCSKVSLVLDPGFLAKNERMPHVLEPIIV